MQKLHFLLRLALFWLLFFAFFRLVFALFYADIVSANDLANTFWAFVIGLRVDIATTCYLLLFPFVLYLAYVFFKAKSIYITLLVYQISVVSAVTLIYVVNIYLYSHWGTLISVRAILYSSYFKETLSFINTGGMILLLLAWIILSTLSCILCYRIALWHFRIVISKVFPSVVFTIILLPFIIIGMRGGLQFTPINESITYYSSKQVNNHIAANVLWHLGFSLLDESDTKNPYLVMPEKRAAEIVRGMMEAKGDSIPQILTTKHPNIVIIMLESWTADAVKELGGDSATTPCFDTLRHRGFLFTQAYASGSRTDHGLASIISGFPGQPTRSIITAPDKARKLPFITDAFCKRGYDIFFYYGGDADFANMRAYLLDAHFSKIIDKAAFPSSEFVTKWGVHDEFVYAKQLQDMNKETHPFLSLIMTLSAHEPYQVPTHKVFPGKTDLAIKFRNALYYSDSCLAAYLKQASHKKWYDSTLFILCADHGNTILWQRDAYTPEAHRITLMLYGGALKKEYQGKEISKTIGQEDIIAMLYDQLGFDHIQFKWSKDVLNPTAKGFACYVNDVAAGIVSGNQHLVYYYSPAKIRDFSPGNISEDSLYNCSRAWLQCYYQEYLNY